jgi:hypothetical protein
MPVLSDRRFARGRWGAERDRDGLRDQNFQQGVDKRGLPNAGLASDDRHIGDDCDPNRCFLTVSKSQLRPNAGPLFRARLQRPKFVPSCNLTRLQFGTRRG